MPNYLVQVGYTPQSWAAQVKNPRNAMERIRPTAEALGGTVESAYYCFGEYDIVGIMQFPDDQAVAAWSMGISAGGATRAFRTTPLMSLDDGVGAMQKANMISSTYVPPT